MSVTPTTYDERTERRIKRISNIGLLIVEQRERVERLTAQLQSERDILAILHAERGRITGQVASRASSENGGTE
jgi:hypothetical protein